MKGQALADLLASHPRWSEKKEDEEDEVTYAMTISWNSMWTMYFDGAAVGQRGGAGTSRGAGVVLMDPEGQLHLHAFSLNFFCTNNTAEYDALICGMELAIKLNVKRLLVRGDSQLVIQQVLGNYETKEQQLLVCKARVVSLLKRFDEVLFEHITRSSNRMADALAVLGSRILQFKEWTGKPVIWFARQDAPSGAILPDVFPVDNLEAKSYKDWYGDVFDYLANGFLPSNSYKSRNIRRKAALYYFDGEKLYKRTADGILLRCLTRQESLDAMREAHEGFVVNIKEAGASTSFC